MIIQLNFWKRYSGQQIVAASGWASMNVWSDIEGSIGKDACTFLREIGLVAHDCGVESYLIGGAVRDAFLGFVSTDICLVDIDIMVLGDVFSLCERLYDLWRDKSPIGVCLKTPVMFPKYQTARLPFRFNVSSVYGNSIGNTVMDDYQVDYIVDLAGARRDLYPVSGMPPQVSAGDLHSDLFRRDFSVNAMAVSLSPSSLGDVIDYFNGLDDLSNKVIRVLHDNSFCDDPARLIRAIRFMTRFNFKLEPRTFDAFCVARRDKYIKRLPPFRLFDELRKALCEKSVDEVVKAFCDYGLLSQICPCFELTETSLEQLRKLSLHNIGGYIGDSRILVWKAALGILCYKCSDEDYKQILTKFGVVKKLLDEFINARGIRFNYLKVI